MRLAWRNLVHDRLRFAVTTVGVAFAVFLMLLQGSLLAGFLRAASRVVDATDTDLWVTARGVQCLDFPAPIPRRFADLALGDPGVRSVRRMVSGTAALRKPSGVTQTVLVVGAEPDVGSDLPCPTVAGRGEVAVPEALLVDRSDAELLDVSETPVDVEVREQRARIVGLVDGFGSFLGTPYVFTGYEDAVSYLGLAPERTEFLLVRVAPGHDVVAVRDSLRALLPEADVWTRDEFSRRCRTYWVAQTGAGGALLTAAFLGFLVGAVVVSQTVYATTMENLEEFATLKALGASRHYVRGVVVTQALAIGLVGSTMGLLAAAPLLTLVRRGISWVHTPAWLPVALAAVAFLMCAAASTVSVRRAVSVEPGRVFRV